MAIADRLGIEFISAMSLPPPRMVTLAARLGVSAIGLAPAPITGNPHGYPDWNLRASPALLRETKAALAEHGVRVSLGEGFLIRPHVDIRTVESDVELMAELGAERLNICAIEEDLLRTFEQFASFAEMAAARGLAATIEFIPGTGVGNLHIAQQVLAAAARPNTGLLIDAMHYLCTGGSAEELANLDPSLILYAQLCDVPFAEVGPDYFDAARNERLIPGEGVLPLAGFVAALPTDCPIGLEVPMFGKARTGHGPEQRLSPAVAAARALLSGMEVAQ